VVGPGAADRVERMDVRVEAGVDVTGVAPVAELPPADTQLVEADWAEVAGWIRRENAAGRPVVVNFFASFCEPCRRELPLLLATAGTERDVTFLGVHTAEQRALGERMVAAYGIDLPSFHDPRTDVLAELDGRVLPYTVAFDTGGRQVGRVFGELTATSLQALLSEARGDRASRG
jgi:thiol-disulfide isomerase/thioredoxin